MTNQHTTHLSTGNSQELPAVLGVLAHRRSFQGSNWLPDLRVQLWSSVECPYRLLVGGRRGRPRALTDSDISIEIEIAI